MGWNQTESGSTNAERQSMSVPVCVLSIYSSACPPCIIGCVSHVASATVQVKEMYGPRDNTNLQTALYRTDNVTCGEVLFQKLSKEMSCRERKQRQGQIPKCGPGGQTWKETYCTWEYRFTTQGEVMSQNVLHCGLMVIKGDRGEAHIFIYTLN